MNSVHNVQYSLFDPAAPLATPRRQWSHVTYYDSLKLEKSLTSLEEHRKSRKSKGDTLSILAVFFHRTDDGIRRPGNGADRKRENGLWRTLSGHFFSKHTYLCATSFASSFLMLCLYSSSESVDFGFQSWLGPSEGAFGVHPFARMGKLLFLSTFSFYHMAYGGVSFSAPWAVHPW